MTNFFGVSKPERRENAHFINISNINISYNVEETRVEAHLYLALYNKVITLSPPAHTPFLEVRSCAGKKWSISTFDMARRLTAYGRIELYMLSHSFTFLFHSIDIQKMENDASGLSAILCRHDKIYNDEPHAECTQYRSGAGWQGSNTLASGERYRMPIYSTPRRYFANIGSKRSKTTRPLITAAREIIDRMQKNVRLIVAIFIALSPLL